MQEGQKSNWWNRLLTIVNFLSLPAAVVAGYQFALEVGSGAVTVISSIQVARESLWAGAFALSFCLLVRAAWPIVKTWRQSQQQKREREEHLKFQLRQTCLENIEGLLFIVNPNHTASVEGRTIAEIAKRWLSSLSLAPPEGSSDTQWHFHLQRLGPYVRAYGVEGAREEVQKRYRDEDQSDT